MERRYDRNTANAGEPRLSFDPTRDLWMGEDDMMKVWMHNATFQIYVRVYCEATFGTKPTAQQQQAVVRHCQRVAYWHGCERNYDPAVHVTRKFPASLLSPSLQGGGTCITR